MASGSSSEVLEDTNLFEKIGEYLDYRSIVIMSEINKTIQANFKENNKLKIIKNNAMTLAQASTGCQVDPAVLQRAIEDPRAPLINPELSTRVILNAGDVTLPLARTRLPQSGTSMPALIRARYKNAIIFFIVSHIVNLAIATAGALAAVQAISCPLTKAVFAQTIMGFELLALQCFTGMLRNALGYLRERPGQRAYSFPISPQRNKIIRNIGLVIGAVELALGIITTAMAKEYQAEAFFASMFNAGIYEMLTKIFLTALLRYGICAQQAYIENSDAVPFLYVTNRDVLLNQHPEMGRVV